MLRGKALSADDKALLIAHYDEYADNGKLSHLAVEIGRPRDTLIHTARKLGLTKRSRPREYNENVKRNPIRKATDDQIAEAYAATKNIWEAARLLGMCGQAVHQRLHRIGIPLQVNRFTHQERLFMSARYDDHASAGTLQVLADEMGRTKHFLCRQAAMIGLTGKKRPKPWVSGDVLTEWRKTNPHPRGMLGKTHNFSAIDKAERTRKAQETKMQRYGTLMQGQENRTDSRSWKSGWREINGRRVFFRSLWEANYGRYLEWLKQRGDIIEWEHEPETFWFEKIKRGTRSYLPDFRVTELNGSVAYHEVKGWMDDKSKTKIARMKRYYPKIRLIVIDAKQYRSININLSRIIPEWETLSQHKQIPIERMLPTLLPKVPGAEPVKWWRINRP